MVCLTMGRTFVPDQDCTVDDDKHHFGHEQIEAVAR